MGQMFSVWLRQITPIPSNCSQRGGRNGFPDARGIGFPCNIHCSPGMQPLFGKWECSCPIGTKRNPNWPVQGQSPDPYSRDGSLNPHRLCIPENQEVIPTPISGTPQVPVANEVVQPTEVIPSQPVVVIDNTQTPRLVRPPRLKRIIRPSPLLCQGKLSTSRTSCCGKGCSRCGGSGCSGFGKNCCTGGIPSNRICNGTTIIDNCKMP